MQTQENTKMLGSCYYLNANTITPCCDDGTSNQTQHKSVIHTVRMSGHKVCMRVLFGNFSSSDTDLHLVGVGLGEDQTTNNVHTHISKS
jgi:hypothetical protein